MSPPPSPPPFAWTRLCFCSVSSMARLLCSAGDEDAAWQALGVLQDGLSHSASNAQFKLLLLLLYCRLGAFEPVVDLYYNLDAKHVQHDTIGSVPSEGLSPVKPIPVQLSSSRRPVCFTFTQVSVDSLCRVFGPLCRSLPVL